MTSLSTYNRLSKIFDTAKELPFDSSSKIVLIGDCHRGDGSWVDDFRHNQSLYYAAVKYYYTGAFTYIDLGDSEELWKNRRFSDISGIYADIYRLLHDYYSDGRYYMIYGNHDIEKKYPEYVREHMQRYYNDHTGGYEPLFENAEVHEGLILRHTETQTKIMLVHGHQGDILSDIFWKLGRFLSRYVWRRLEFFGHNDPTSAAKNFQERRKVERKILEWVEKNKRIVIAGHTHRPSCPSEGELPYFNVGSCVHPNCITCIEIVNSEILLVKWCVKTRDDRTYFVEREPLSLPRKI
ncbi:MAG: metallophosphoesterase family protein [Oscillospiraceae bacterium]|nr:metallophosphoesterase family protein [Oscillospiraceae bacterium]